MSNIRFFSLSVVLLAFANVSNAGLISIGDSGLTGTDRYESFDTGGLGTNVSNQFVGNGLTFSTISGSGVTLTSNSHCGNYQSGVSNQYLYAGLNSLCGANSTSVDSFSILFDETVSELSWSGFNRAIHQGFTIQALLNGNLVSSIIFDINNRFENKFVTFSDANFNEIRVIENGVGNSLFFAMDDFSWNVTSVPEPTTLTLMGLGLVGLGFARKKKNS